MLATNKNGWKLIEYIDIPEEDIEQYQNVTGAYAILKVADKYVVGYNDWRKQWEFPAGGIDEGESAREAAIRELYEETGAIKVKIEPVCIYSISTYSILCFAEIEEMIKLPEFEIEEVGLFDNIPKKLSFPDAHTILFNKVLKSKNLK